MPEVQEQKIEHPSVQDSLREALNSSRNAESPAADVDAAPEVGPVDAPQEGQQESSPSGEQPRGPDGKFAPKSVQEQVERQLKGRQAPTQAATPVAIEAPQHWPEEEKQFFAELPSDAARERYLNKVKSLETGYNKKFEDIANWKKAVDPFNDYLQSLGASPQQAIQYLLNADRMMRYGTPEQKAHAAKLLFDEYQIPLPNGQPAPAVQPAAQQQTEGEHWDPVVNSLRQELGQLKNVLTSRQQQEQQAEQQRVIASIVEFQNAKTEAGQLANPYFSEVADDIALLAQAERLAGRKPDLAKLYDKACWNNETVRAKVLADRDAEQAKARQAQTQQRVQQAKSAGSSVSGAPVGGSASGVPAKSVLEEVTRAYQSSGGRRV